MSRKKYSKNIQRKASQYGVEIYQALGLRWDIEGQRAGRMINAFGYEYLAAKTKLNDFPKSVFNELLTKGRQLTIKLVGMQQRLSNEGACWCYCFNRFCEEKVAKEKKAKKAKQAG